MSSHCWAPDKLPSSDTGEWLLSAVLSHKRSPQAAVSEHQGLSLPRAPVRGSGYLGGIFSK